MSFSDNNAAWVMTDVTLEKSFLLTTLTFTLILFIWLFHISFLTSPFNVKGKYST